MNIFGTRFAGDALSSIGSNISAAYNSVDGKLGGLLPGGTDVDLGNLGKEAMLDILPGTRSHSHTGAVTEKGKNFAGDIIDGDYTRAAIRAEAGKNTGRLREHILEEGVERIGRRAVNRALTRGTAYAVPVFGQAITTYDAINDAAQFADIGVEALTGKGYGRHVDDTIAMRDSNSGVNALDVDPGYVGDGIHEIGQGTAHNPLQEIGNRIHMVKENFDPLNADLGISEAMGWN